MRRSHLVLTQVLQKGGHAQYGAERSVSENDPGEESDMRVVSTCSDLQPHGFAQFGRVLQRVELDSDFEILQGKLHAPPGRSRTCTI
jgi:hypothetical protein